MEGYLFTRSVLKIWLEYVVVYRMRVKLRLIISLTEELVAYSYTFHIMFLVLNGANLCNLSLLAL